MSDVDKHLESTLGAMPTPRRTDAAFAHAVRSGIDERRRGRRLWLAGFAVASLAAVGVAVIHAHADNDITVPAAPIVAVAHEVVAPAVALEPHDDATSWSDSDDTSAHMLDDDTLLALADEGDDDSALGDVEDNTHLPTDEATLHRLNSTLDRALHTL